MKATKTNVLILGVALFLLLFPFVLLYLIEDAILMWWYWVALGILIVATWLNEHLKKNIVEAKQ